jgi:hypothetical protein
MHDKTDKDAPSGRYLDCFGTRGNAQKPEVVQGLPLDIKVGDEMEISIKGPICNSKDEAGLHRQLNLST